VHGAASSNGPLQIGLTRGTLALRTERQDHRQTSIVVAAFKFLGNRKVHSEPDISSSLDPFWSSLSVTIVWCLPRIDPANPATCLRSSRTRPRLFTTSHLDTVREALHGRYLSPKPAQTRDLRGGRLLVYFPDQELADGAAEAESQGFLDVNNAPPWDTWIAFIQTPGDANDSHLISWVPREFIALVDAGIRVNPEECIAWLEDANIELRDPLTAALRTGG
jgi:hypothetical protein